LLLTIPQRFPPFRQGYQAHAHSFACFPDKQQRVQICLPRSTCPHVLPFPLFACFSVLRTVFQDSFSQPCLGISLGTKVDPTNPVCPQSEMFPLSVSPVQNPLLCQASHQGCLRGITFRSALTQYVHLRMVFYYVHSCACLTFPWPFCPLCPMFRWLFPPSTRAHIFPSLCGYYR